MTYLILFILKGKLLCYIQALIGVTIVRETQRYLAYKRHEELAIIPGIFTALEKVQLEAFNILTDSVKGSCSDNQAQVIKHILQDQDDALLLRKKNEPFTQKTFKSLRAIYSRYTADFKPEDADFDFGLASFQLDPDHVPEVKSVRQTLYI